MKITPKHGKSAPRRNSAGGIRGSYVKNQLQVVRDDHTWRSLALVSWPRGFEPADAPPDVNEWTRRPRPCSNGPHRR